MKIRIGENYGELDYLPHRISRCRLKNVCLG